METVGEGVPPNGHGQGVGRYLSPLQGRSLLPWNSDLPSSHHLHVGVWRCMCVPTKCECGMSVSFHQVMFSCTSCSDHFQLLTGKLRSVGLAPVYKKPGSVRPDQGVPGEIKRSRDLRGGRWSWTLTFAQKRS